MIRAGAVNHPKEWPHSGYHEIVVPPERYQLLDRKKLLELLRINDSKTLSDVYDSWVSEVLTAEGKKRDKSWTQTVAVGGEPFVKKVKRELAGKAVGRSTEANESEEFMCSKKQQLLTTPIWDMTWTVQT